MGLNPLLRRGELANPQVYDGKHELKFAIAACGVWFVGILLRLNSPDQQWTLIEQLIEAASFIVFAGIPVFFLATRQGAKLARSVLLKKQGLGFQLFICTTLAIYITLVKLLSLNPQHFVWLNQMENLILYQHFWANSIFFILGIFAALRVPFLLLNLRNQAIQTKQGGQLSKKNIELPLFLSANLVYLIASHTSLVSKNFNFNQLEGYYIAVGYLLLLGMIQWSASQSAQTQRLTTTDLFLILICLSILFWFSTPFFSFGVFIGVDLFIMVIIYGLGLGREHFGYSFQIRPRDIGYLLATLLLISLILIPLGLFSGFIDSSRVNFAPNPIMLLSYFILFSFRVGIFEEIFFRCGLMVFLRDQLYPLLKPKINPKTAIFLIAAIVSVIFGITHVGNQPGAESLLTPIAYKFTYICLATLASLFYSLAFAETNRLWCSITIHGYVDSIAVVCFGGFLTVPF